MKEEITKMHEELLEIFTQYHNSYLEFHKYPSYRGSDRLNSKVLALTQHLRSMRKDLMKIRKAHLEAKRIRCAAERAAKNKT